MNLIRQLSDRQCGALAAERGDPPFTVYRYVGLADEPSEMNDGMSSGSEIVSLELREAEVDALTDPEGGAA